ncbi:MAG: asparagine synthase (glutamine-hydrolyzing) [Gemmatimonadaceae bacterium]
MCGINGIFSYNGRPVSADELARMRDTMAHRGPDGTGAWISSDGKVGLGHRRLSIIDLSSLANQPMTNEDSSLQIVYNGEIYNHAEIRRELEAMGGHQWRTDHSDTEMILHAYETWGIDCIHRFRGMFAIALWDSRKQQLWLVRDRIGIKPIYYTVVQGRLLFASEIKALLTLPEVERAVDHEALFNYLSFLTAPAPRTLFKGIYKLPASTRLCISHDGSQRQERYWDAWDHTTPLLNVSEEEIAERLLSELRTSVKYRKVSDVPVGIFLSGGIDSSANAKLFSEDGGPVRTFSIGYDAKYESYKSELPYARSVAKFVGAEHHDMELDIDHVLSFLEPMVYHQDEPIGDVVCVPLYYVSKLARDNGVIVCQVGEGADELFCGYPTWAKHLQMARLNRLPVPRAIKAVGLQALSAAGHRTSFAYEYLRRAVRQEPLFRGGAEGLTEYDKWLLLGADLRREFQGASSADSIVGIRQRFLSKAWEKSDMHWMSYLDLNLRLPELLLMRVDKMSMATSIEGRVPFLDHKFVELALSIPTAVKIPRPGELKHILKKAVRGVIPDDIIDRKKQGFGVPMKEWIGGRIGDEITRRIDRFAATTGIFDQRTVGEYVRRARWSQVWQLFNVAQWHAQFIERPVASTPSHLPPAVSTR